MSTTRMAPKRPPYLAVQPVIAAPPVLNDAANDPAARNPVRIMCAVWACGLIFLRISYFHQIQTYLMGFNLGLLYIFGIPTTFGTLLYGLRRTFRNRLTYYWIAFVVWIVLGLPFSTWRGDSIMRALAYIRTDVAMLFIAGGLAIGWKEFRWFLKAILWGAFGTLLVARLFQGGNSGSRFSLEVGSMANSNDLAAHILFCLPFFYWMALSSKSMPVKLLSLIASAYGVFMVVQTASRGGLLGLAAMLLAVVVWGTAQQKLAILAVAALLGSAIIVVVPGEVLTRITSFSSASAATSDVSAEASESSESRKYLLEKSIEYTVQHPLFGIGFAQFLVFEGTHSTALGEHGLWHNPHNGFMEISSECGIPALIFFVLGVGATYRTFYRIFRRACTRPEYLDIKNAMFCLMLSMTGFMVAFTFLNLAYAFYVPFYAGLALSAASAAEQEFATRLPQAA